MASLADVLSEKERTNWLKAWLALDIAKSGLQKFVQTEAQNFHTSIFSPIWSSMQAPASCIGCNTANLLKCPTPGVCNKRRPNSFCTAIHDTVENQTRACPLNICDQVRVEIEKYHRYNRPSWKCTSANQWASNPWEIAKSYFPPDGYERIRSIQETDFNGMISFMLNCSHFDRLFSFTIATAPNPPCLLTKARFICKNVRHSSEFKLTDAELHDHCTTLADILNDPYCLAQDQHAQEALRKLTMLQLETLQIPEMIRLLEHSTTQKCELLTLNAVNEIKAYVENIKRELETPTKKKSYIQDCEALKQRITKYYNTHLWHTPLSVLKPLQDIPLMDIYVPPKILKLENVNDQSQTDGMQLKTYKDILKRDTRNRPIFLRGDPGTGKSTFAAKLVLDWCYVSSNLEPTPDKETLFGDLHTLHEYDFLFLVTLRDSPDQREVMHMIKEQIIDNIYADMDQAKVYELLQEVMQKERCLLIQDGIDEWCHYKGKQCTPLLQTCYDRCTVLITTRPWKIAESIKDSNIGILLEIKGISNPYRLAENIFALTHSKHVECLEFKAYINTHALKEFLPVPMMLTIIACLWIDGVSLNGSLCKIFSTLLESLLKKVTHEHGFFDDSHLNCFKDTLFIKPNITCLKALAKVAFHSIFSFEREKSFVFSEKLLYQYLSHETEKENIHRFALHVGILTQRRSSPFKNTSATFSFVHRSIQEFLAAIYIADNMGVIDGDLSDFVTKSEDNHQYLSDVFKYLCGLNINAANNLSCVLYNHVARISTSQPHFFESRTFQKILISGYKEALANGFKQSQIHLRISHIYCDVSSSCKADFEIVTRILEANISNLRSWYILDDTLRPFKRFPEETKDITKDEINRRYTVLQGKYELFDLSPFANLERIHLIGIVKLLPKALCNLPNLKHITIHTYVTQIDCLDLSASQWLETVDVGHITVVLPTILHGTTLKFSGICDPLNLSLCHNLETVELSSEVKLTPNAISPQCNIKNLKVLGSCDRLNLPYNHYIQTLHISDCVRLLPVSLRGNIKQIKLNCICSGLDLSSCINLQDIELGTRITLAPLSVSLLPHAKKLKLNCTCDELDLQNCYNLEQIELGDKITLSPEALCGRFKHLKFNGKCFGLDLKYCNDLETIELGYDVNLLPGSFPCRMKSISLICKCVALDLSLCVSLTDIAIGERVTLEPTALSENVQHLDLQGVCSELDLSKCNKLKTIFAGSDITLTTNCLTNCKELTDLVLLGTYRELNLSLHTNLNKLQTTFKMESLSLKCNCQFRKNYSDTLDALQLNQNDIRGLGEDWYFLLNTVRDFNVRRINITSNKQRTDLFSIELFRKSMKGTTSNESKIKVVQMALISIEVSTSFLQRLFNSLLICTHNVNLQIERCQVSTLDNQNHFVEKLCINIFNGSFIINNMDNKLIEMYELLQGRFGQINENPVLLRSLVDEITPNIQIPHSRIHLIIVNKLLSSQQLRKLVFHLSTVDCPMACHLMLSCDFGSDVMHLRKGQMVSIEYVGIQAWKYVYSLRAERTIYIRTRQSYVSLVDDSDNMEALEDPFNFSMKALECPSNLSVRNCELC
ncbi:uncharacterized protein LOC127850360 [Dreissena polymorpha]|uniref:NACHT domain-containing protein n=1 Tax=Dreissena polymorpha TaxID=45954 RepID=A0A9D4CXY1_DREPO|nr:uncharacterized protein LOC127850360 [Dreissena polymorpha]XP_052239296.1 uncharacterized protein LOC127850360 [Dreissena polymorpha]XP_052239297.1 uncharacterized protein LOC127850360 [Dreissena polymorpha]KAH3734119.1 hypothetical protein DPMN_040559 [Dreissena polymorpha]